MKKTYIFQFVHFKKIYFPDEGRGAGGLGALILFLAEKGAAGKISLRNTALQQTNGRNS